jgi:alcohol dehydrogenase class IV
VQPNLTDKTVETGAELLRKDSSFDFIIAVSGGSSIDTGKGIALLATKPGTLRDYQGHTVEDFYKTSLRNCTDTHKSSKTKLRRSLTDTQEHLHGKVTAPFSQPSNLVPG